MATPGPFSVCWRPHSFNQNGYDLHGEHLGWGSGQNWAFPFVHPPFFHLRVS